MKHDIRLIAADFDGTLLSSDGSISAFNKLMIKKAQDKGIVFAAATGRYPENAAQIMVDEGIVCPIISTNGAVVELSPFGERIHEQIMDAASARKVFDVLEGFNEGYYIFGRRSVINRWTIPRHISEQNELHLAKLKQRVTYSMGLDACKDALATPIYKFFVIFDHDENASKEIQAALAPLEGVEFTSSGGRNLEIMPSGTDKGKGLEVLAKHYGIAQAQMMALGDQLNDLSMIKYAGLGIAMGNAADAVKKHADAITAPFDEDGVAKAIEKYCF
ncbi:MAG: HAD family phosphatase [Clostridiales bacterium]|nr:HAD family phosphatase [Clostridiales bacterium]